MYGICFGVVIIFCGVMMSGLVLADGADVVDRVGILIPSSCTMSGTGMSSHNTEIPNGTYQADIGTSMIHAFCNDADGFAIYAAGYTGNEVEGIDSNKLIGTSASGNATIETGLATSAGSFDMSNWAMKLAMTQDSGDTSGTNAFSIDSAPNESGGPNASFTQYHVVPTIYTKVAHKNAMTDMATSLGGIKFTTTYAAYISKMQPADTYTGQVIYTLVHPASIPAPKSTMLDTGRVVGAKMKSLAAGVSKAYNDKTSDIKAIRMADELPVGFVPSEANTVSTVTSKHPIYIFFDNTDDAGIIYFYTGGFQVVMNPDSSHMFRSNLALSDISGVSDWDSSCVVSMQAMFVDATFSLNNVDALADWDTSAVEDMRSLFSTNSATFDDGYPSNLSDISGLLKWDTSSVVTIQALFQNNTSLTSLHGLEFWNVSKMENMRLAFAAGSNHDLNLLDISALTNWDTSSVTNMRAVFQNNKLLSDLSPLANWDTSQVKDMTSMFVNNLMLSDASPLANWKTSKVEDMTSMFANCKMLLDLSPLSNWDISKVESMASMFGLSPGETKNGNPVIDLSPIANWNVSSVVNMSCLFQNVNIASFLPLAGWDVGKVENFSYTFNQTSKSTTTSLAGLEDWNVSSATNMNGMFADSVSLADASAIDDWNIGDVTDFTEMFSRAPVHPNFTMRSGTWNNNGTFIPSP